MLSQIAESIIAGKAPVVEELVKAALEEHSPEEIIQKGLLGGMAVIGERFKKNEVYVPEVLIAARAMKAGLKVLEPHLTENAIEPVATMVLGTVEGDLHDIGKNLVAMMFEGAGFRVIDLGVDVKAEQFSEAIEAHQPQLLGLSALLTTTMPAMEKIIEHLKERGLRDQVKVLVGGAPLSGNFAAEIGADGYAPDASSAVDVAKKVLGVS